MSWSTSPPPGAPLPKMSNTPPRLRSASVSQSRSHGPAAQDSEPYIPNDPADLALAAGLVGEEAADVLNHSSPAHAHEAEDTLVDQSEEVVETRERTLMAARPWWKRPAPWW
jgi:hypothetical protein